MIDIKKLQTLAGILDYPDPNDSSKGTTEQEFQEYLKNHYGIIFALVSMSLWQPGAKYIQGQIIRSPNMPPNTVARVTKAGTTEAAEPVWGDVGGIIADGTVEYIMLPETLDFATQEEVTKGIVDNKIVSPSMLGQTLQIDLASTKRVNINEGDKSVTAGVTGILPVAHGGTGMDHLPYTPNEKGSAWDGTHFPAIDADGAMEVGKAINFHETNSSDPLQVSVSNGGLSITGKLNLNGNDILDTISKAGVVDGNVSNANAWWIKIGGKIPLIIQGGNGSVFPVAFPTSWLTLQLTPFGDHNTQNNLHVNWINNTGFGAYNNEYDVHYLAIGV